MSDWTRGIPVQPGIYLARAYGGQLFPIMVGYFDESARLQFAVLEPGRMTLNMLREIPPAWEWLAIYVGL